MPDDLERAPDRAAFEALRERWVARGWVAGSGPGPGSGALVEGGFRRLWLDLPGRLTLYANQQGGYHVTCPRCGEGVAGPFARAVQAWREGAPRGMICPRCSAQLLLEELELAPPGRFARGAVIFADSGALHLEPEAQRELEDALGPMVTVSRRVG